MGTQLDLFAPKKAKHTKRKGDRTVEKWVTEQPGWVPWGSPGWAPMQGPTRLTLVLEAPREQYEEILKRLDALERASPAAADDAPAPEVSRE